MRTRASFIKKATGPHAPSREETEMIRDAGMVRFTTRGQQRSLENSSVTASRAIRIEGNKRTRGSQKKDVADKPTKKPSG